MPTSTTSSRLTHSFPSMHRPCSLPPLLLSTNRLPLCTQLPSIQDHILAPDPSLSSTVAELPPPSKPLHHKGSIASLLNEDAQENTIHVAKTTTTTATTTTALLPLVPATRISAMPSPVMTTATITTTPLSPPTSPPPTARLPLPVSPRNKKRSCRFSCKKSLRRFSKLVCDKVAEHGETTHSRVADELIRDLYWLDAACAEEQKNVRRRVYDALNVLVAVGVVVKDRKRMIWTGLSGVTDDPLERAIAAEEARQGRLVQRVHAAEQMTRDSTRRLVCLSRLVALNRQRHPASHPPPPHRVPLPMSISVASSKHGSKTWSDVHVAETLLPPTRVPIESWLPDPSWACYLAYSTDHVSA